MIGRGETRSAIEACLALPGRDIVRDRPAMPTSDVQDQPSSFKAQPEFQILVMCLILSPSKFIEYT
jgi:hypothetical protein